MALLRPRIPTEKFITGENTVLYTGALPDSIKSVVDMDAFDKIPLEQIWDCETGLKHLIYFRHFESAYNYYKSSLSSNPLWNEYLKEENFKRKVELQYLLEADFIEKVDIDSRTPLSQKGHEQGENAAKVLSKLFSLDPSLIPTRYNTSPYLRTRQTTYYNLKDIGADIDLDQLLLSQEDANHTGVLRGSCMGKDIVIQIDENMRERDHGNINTPRFITQEMVRYKKERNIPLETSQERFSALLDSYRFKEEAYYKTYAGGESQVQCNARHKVLITSFANTPDIIQGGSGHHLGKLGFLNTLMGGGYYNFRNFDDHYKPINGGMTILSQVKETKHGSKDRIRVSAYNMEMVDEGN